MKPIGMALTAGITGMMLGSLCNVRLLAASGFFLTIWAAILGG